jgi:hypothetical protein
MDRIGFLSSFPFVIPLQSTAWPPASLGSPTTAKAKVLIGAKEYNNLHRTFVVSIEIQSSSNRVQNQEERNERTKPDESFYRPAFFSVHPTGTGTTSSPVGFGNNDPSLSIFELAFLQQQEPNDKQDPVSGDHQVFIRINEQAVFFLDLQRQCAHMEMVPSTTIQREGETATRTLPCSLLLQFQNVSFRIFTMNDSTSTNTAFVFDDADVQATFQEVLATLRPICRGGTGRENDALQHNPSLWNMIPTDCIAKAYRLSDAAGHIRSPGSRSSPSTEDTSHTTVDGGAKLLQEGFQNNDAKNSSSTTSPTTTTSSAKKRTWQSESSPMSMKKAKDGTEPTTPAVSSDAVNQRAADDDDDILPEPRRKLQRHVQVFRQAATEMEKLRRVVEMPVASIPIDDHTANGSTSSSLMQGLLNSTALHLSQSYIPQADRVQIEEAYDALLREKQQATETLLQSFFPSVPSHQQRRGQRQLRSSAEKAVSGSARKVDSGAAPDAATIAEQCTQLLQEQKRLVQERYKLLLLPSRG